MGRRYYLVEEADNGCLSSIGGFVVLFVGIAAYLTYSTDQEPSASLTATHKAVSPPPVVASPGVTTCYACGPNPAQSEVTVQPAGAEAIARGRAENQPEHSHVDNKSSKRSEHIAPAPGNAIEPTSDIPSSDRK